MHKSRRAGRLPRGTILSINATYPQEQVKLLVQEHERVRELNVNVLPKQP